MGYFRPGCVWAGCLWGGMPYVTQLLKGKVRNDRYSSLHCMIELALKEILNKFEVLRILIG